ncbi:hypothetical protein [Rhizobium laguerreae]|uniref:hypothetical protein n=1 Tax=Rhizobium laguerreae TaxID=1076926 RepID=UPI001C918B85|nr:hypothetical protein [Rhizobium laguerreae]MBY3363758.1 hypothetical protein [Rhizobium laguerreae]
MPTHSPTVDVNKVIWITSLSEEEYSVTRRIHDDLLPYLLSQGIIFEELEPQSGAELLQQLDDLAVDATNGVRPIIHIDTHGNEQGLGIKATNEMVPWEAIVDRFKKINIATENNLCVISLACFGFHVIEPISITDTTPFYIVAGSQQKVYEDYIESVTVDFYKYMFDNNDIVGAYNKFLAGQLRVLHCEKLVHRALAGYIRAGTMGEGAAERIEGLLARLARDTPPGKIFNAEEARRLLEEEIRPDQGLLERRVQQFLIGRKPQFDIDEVIEHAKTMPDPYADRKRARPNPLDHI